MKKKIALHILTFLLAFVFMGSSFLPIAYAGRLKDYEVHNSGVFGFGGKWDYQKNDDGEDTITLVKCNSEEAKELTSPIDSHDVTRVGKNFSFIWHGRPLRNTLSMIPLSVVCPPIGILYFSSEVDVRDFYSTVNSVNLPKCIKVEEGGFKFCRSLETVKLPSCEEIDPGAFYDNRKLNDITLSKNYKVVKRGTFENCFSLKNFKNFDFVEKLENRAFFSTAFEKLVLKSCKSIGDQCFSMCHLLTEVIAPVCESLGSRGFAGCINLKSVKLPLCKSVGEYAFSHSGVPWAESGFTNGNLKSVYLPNCKNVGLGAFENCVDLEDVDISSCEEICPCAFKCCHKINGGLKNLYNLKKIGGYAFENCRSLEKIYLDKCEILNEGVFKDCEKLKFLSLASCKFIGNNAFENCRSLEKIYLDKCEILNEGVFKDCEKLKFLSLASCKLIGNNTFENCKGLTELRLDSCEKVSSNAFKDCSNLKTIYLPNCKKIENGAFIGCDSLCKIVIPKNCVLDNNSLPINNVINNCIEFV